MNEHTHQVSKLLAPNDFGKLLQHCSEESVAYLEQSLKRLEAGSPPTPSFPLYGKRDISVVEDWIKDASRKVPVPEFVLKYETKRLEKFAPQGGIPKWADVEDDFLLYKTALRDVKYVDPAVMREMKGDYSYLKCQQKGITEALDHLKRTDKVEERAAGWTTFQLKKTDPEAQRAAVAVAKSDYWDQGVGYTFTRLVKKKLRLFMPMPFSSMIMQAQYYIPFLGGIQNDILQKGTRSPSVLWADKVGFAKCFKIMEEELNQRVKEGDRLVYYSLDFEKMDTTTGTSQYRNIFYPILDAAFGRKDAMRDKIMDITTTAPIYSPGGTMVGDHGTASGAEVTNGGETVCNDYVQRRILKILRKLLPKGWKIVVRRANGDDSVLIFVIYCEFEVFKQALLQAVEQACNETGFRVQIDKQEISETNGFFCQHQLWYDIGKRKLNWLYPTSLILNSIINPQKQYKPADWDKDYRDLDVTEKLDNGHTHPWFTILIDYVDSGLKYPLLGKDEAETRRIISKYEKYRSLQSLGERYNRQDYHISESPTLNYVLSKR